MASPALAPRIDDAVGQVLDSLGREVVRVKADDAEVNFASLTEEDVRSVWEFWNQDYICSTSSSCNVVVYNTPLGCSSYEIWNSWNLEYQTCAANVTSVTISHDVLWRTWNGQWGPSQQDSWRSPTREESESRERELRAQYEKEKVEREAAQVRARSLLLENLDARQREQFERAQTFEVHSGDGKRVYQVRYGIAGNIFLLDKEGKPTKKFCIHPTDGRIPTEDVMLVQKLMIEGCEEEFVKIANKTNVA